MLSRFLSPDPGTCPVERSDNGIQAPGLPQNYNRYTYCLNNPLLYTDPTGNKWYEPWTWSLKRGWDNVWEGLNNFAKWADETPWFPSTGGVGINSAGHTSHYVGDYYVDHNQMRVGSNEAIWGRTTVTFNNGINQDGVNFANNLGVASDNVRFKYDVGDIVDGKTISDFSGDFPLELNPDGVKYIGGYAPAIGVPAGRLIDAGRVGISLLMSVDITAKMTGEISRLSSKIRPRMGVVYELQATASGYYPNINTGGSTMLNVGDTYKYGESINPGTRYSTDWLVRNNLRMVNLGYGNQTKIKIMEKYYIYGYYYMHGVRPPGNSIFR